MLDNNILEYQGYHTKAEFDSEDSVLRGKIEGINDLVNFECENVKNAGGHFPGPANSQAREMSTPRLNFLPSGIIRITLIDQCSSYPYFHT